MLAAFAVLVVAFGVLARGDASLVQAGTYVAIFAPAAIGLSVLLHGLTAAPLAVRYSRWYSRHPQRHALPVESEEVAHVPWRLRPRGD